MLEHHLVIQLQAGFNIVDGGRLSFELELHVVAVTLLSVIAVSKLSAAEAIDPARFYPKKTGIRVAGHVWSLLSSLDLPPLSIPHSPLKLRPPTLTSPASDAFQTGQPSTTTKTQSPAKSSPTCSITATPGMVRKSITT